MPRPAPPAARPESSPASRTLLALGLVAASALCAAPPASADIFGRKKPAPAPVAAPVAPAPPVAVVLPAPALPGAVLQAASAYRAYARTTGAMKAGFTAGQQIETMLEIAETSEPLGLSRGVVAYGAVVALQEPSFVEGVRRYSDPSQRRVIVERISNDPAYAASLPGASAAAALIARVLGADGARVAGAGALVKQSAYDMQRQKWSKLDIPDRPGRLARAKTLAAKPMPAAPADIAELGAAASGPVNGQSRLVEVSVTTGAAIPPYTSTVVRALAVAALAALGEAGDGNDAVVQTLLNDPSGSYCHNMAKLNLYQCLAVAKPFYEDAFCLGQHVLIDTGQCVVKGAGSTPAPVGALTAAAGAPALASAGSSALASR